MSQADDRTTTIPSRRALLAGLSVAAAAGVAGLPAGAAAAPIEPDPIFAVIAAYRAAVQAYCAACNAPDDEQDETSTWPDSGLEIPNFLRRGNPECSIGAAVPR